MFKHYAVDGSVKPGTWADHVMEINSLQKKGDDCFSIDLPCKGSPPGYLLPLAVSNFLYPVFNSFVSVYLSLAFR